MRANLIAPQSRSRFSALDGGLQPVGGLLVFVGFAGIALTTALYALAPPAAGLPAHPFDAAAALAGAVSGAAALRAAGLVGMASDILAAMGTILVVLELGQRGRGLAAAGWAGVLLSILVFTFVDTMVGLVLVPLATDAAAAAAFIGAKRLFDALFLTGTAAFGIGAVLLSCAELRVPTFGFGRYDLAAALLVGAACFSATVACIAGAPLHLLLGGTIGLGGLLFTRLGVKLFAPRQAETLDQDHLRGLALLAEDRLHPQVDRTPGF